MAAGAAAGAAAVAAADVERHGEHLGAGGEFPGGAAAGGRDPEGAGVSAGRVRSRQDAAAEGARGDADRADQLAGERLNRHLSPFAKADAQYSPTREEQIPELQKVDARRGARSSTISSTARTTASSRSSVRWTPADDSEGRGRRCSASWNTAKAYKPLVTPFKKAAPINEKIETPDKANAQFLAGARFQLSQNDPDYPAIVLASYMFGEPITSRISDRIRNREGLSYGANARITVPAEGDAAMLSGTVSLNPGVGPKVEVSFIDELKKVYDKGFTAAEVDGGEEGVSSTSRMVGPLDRRRAAQPDGVARAAGPPVQVGRGSRGEDPGAHRGAGQRGVPQAHRSGRRCRS